MKALVSCLLAASLFTAVGCVSRPPTATRPPGLGQTALPIIGAGAGAAIGARTSGAKGAAIGGVAGGLAGLIGGKAIDAMTSDNREEYAAAQVRAARVQMMNDLNESEAANGGNGPQDGESPKKTVKMVYPPGMYEGVYYGPREMEVPATN